MISIKYGLTREWETNHETTECKMKLWYRDWGTTVCIYISAYLENEDRDQSVYTQSLDSAIANRSIWSHWPANTTGIWLDMSGMQADVSLSLLFGYARKIPFMRALLKYSFIRLKFVDDLCVYPSFIYKMELNKSVHIMIERLNMLLFSVSLFDLKVMVRRHVVHLLSSANTLPDNYSIQRVSGWIPSNHIRRA